MSHGPNPEGLQVAEGLKAAMLEAAEVPIGAEVVDFRGYFKVEIFPHNAVIYRPGDPANRVFLVKRGRVRLIRTGRNAARSVLAILKSGDLFGDFLLGDGGTAEELSVASGEAEVWSIEGGEFKAPAAWEQIFGDVPLMSNGQPNWAAKWVNEAYYDSLLQLCGTDMQDLTKEEKMKIYKNIWSFDFWKQIKEKPKEQKPIFLSDTG